MNTTTVTRSVETDQLTIVTTSPSPTNLSPTNPSGPTRLNRRQRAGAVAVSLAIVGGAAFLVVQATTANHGTTDTVSPKLSSANAALIGGDVAPVTHELSPANRALIASGVVPTRQLSPANRAIVSGEVAPVTSQLSPADRALIAGNSAVVTPQISAADRAQIAR
jgi:hypothetical protein